MVRDEGLRFRLTQREQTGTLASVPPGGRDDSACREGMTHFWDKPHVQHEEEAASPPATEVRPR